MSKYRGGRRGGRRQGGYMKKYYKGKANRELTYGRMGQKVFTDMSYLVNTVAKLKGLINTEFKSLDTAVTATITSTPVITLLNGCAKGDTLNTRDGRQIRLKSVAVNLQCTMHATPLDDMLRVMLVIDKQPNVTALVIGDLLVNTNMGSMRNLDNRKRFVILRDERVVLSVGGGTNTFWQYYKELDMHTIYDGSDAGTIADITSNALYLIIFSTEAANGPSVSRTTRVRFLDN